MFIGIGNKYSSTDTTFIEINQNIINLTLTVTVILNWNKYGIKIAKQCYYLNTTGLVIDKNQLAKS